MQSNLFDVTDLEDINKRQGVVVGGGGGVEASAGFISSNHHHHHHHKTHLLLQQEKEEEESNRKLIHNSSLSTAQLRFAHFFSLSLSHFHLNMIDAFNFLNIYYNYNK